MKTLLRSGPISSVLGWLIWSYMALCARTIRWRTAGVEGAQASWPHHSATIMGTWHHQILLLPTAWIRHVQAWHTPRGRGAMLISLSADGEPVAKAIEHLGLESVRGSARHKRKNKDKGGREALKLALEILRDGGGVCLTPDGPRGPNQQVKSGPAVMAKRADAVFIPFAIQSTPCRRLDTWDGFAIPIPFSRGAYVFGPAVKASDFDTTEALRESMQQHMDSANQRCRELLSET